MKYIDLTLRVGIATHRWQPFRAGRTVEAATMDLQAHGLAAAVRRISELTGGKTTVIKRKGK